ncbi:hypothetical protein [Marinomonas pollencensis]|uniref:Uncharacterized protein n=1 Tax=Marinomonas pollencensis TaxID=491954 RepID=A0A3E0DQD7_9GAMM|nr:hypothetical protein [Marinomonas pollencensis]REG85130.1 hypothetical protein DFP81_103330 [Marinomonas pollencensis]
MAISPISNSDWHKLLPSKSSRSKFQGLADATHTGDTLHLSSRARLMNEQFAKGEMVETEQDFVRLSSSTGHSTRWSGLSHEEAIAIYRTIEAMASKTEHHS